MERSSARARGICAIAVGVLLAAASVDAADLRLVDAAKRHDLNSARALIREGLNVNTPSPDGTTALHWAVHHDDLPLATALIKAGAHVDVLNDYGVRALAMACTNASAPMVQLLLQAGANAKAPHALTGETPILTAARSGRTEVVKTLIAYGADVNAAEPEAGQTPLMWASAEGHADVARLLLESGAQVSARSKGGFSPLLFAARAGDLKTVQLLVGRGATLEDAAPNGMSALLLAIYRGRIELATTLLDMGADPNVNGTGYTPLHWATGEWTNELTSRLEETSEWAPLGGLRRETRLAVAKILLSHGADPNAKVTKSPRGITGQGGHGINLPGATPFLIAAQAADAPLMRLLLAAGADPRVSTADGTTPLMAAAGLAAGNGSSLSTEEDAFAAVMVALEVGNDVNAVNRGNDTALHGASWRALDTIVQLLVDKGARVNVRNQRGWTAWTIADGISRGAAYISSKSTADLLLKLGAEPDPPNGRRAGISEAELTDVGPDK